MKFFRRYGVAGYVCAVALLIGWCSQRPFARQGDGWEYLSVLEAFARHGSPDVRADDVTALFDEVDRWEMPPAGAASVRERFGAELPHSFTLAPDGRSHAMHFWMYSLFALPAKLMLHALGGREFNALIVTNAWLLAAALAVAAGAGRQFSARLALALLLAVTPVLWYITFTGVEVFCWALAVVSLACLDRERYVASAMAAALAATQNPPMALLAAVPVLVASRRAPPVVAGATLAAASVALLPVIWNWWYFGVASLIAVSIDLDRVSIGRTIGMLVDLNAGLLPYVPVLLIAAPLAAWRLARRGDRRAVLIALAVVGMLLAVQTQINWNSDGRGLRRYLVWMLPPLAWLVVTAWSGRWRNRFVAVAVVSSGAVLIFDPPTRTTWLEHRPLARWVMRELPWLYNPDFESFVERSVHGEAPPRWLLEGRPDGWMVALPVAHGRANGEVTKLLVQRDSAGELPRRFRIDPAYLPELRRRAEASVTPTYVHPPPGTVWATPGSIDGIYAPYAGPLTAPAPP